MFRKVFEHSPHATLISDLDRKIIICNQAGATLLGYSEPSELTGLSIIELLHPDERERAMTERPRVINKGIAENLLYRLKRKDGSVFLSENFVQLLRDDEGAPQAFLIKIADLTERKKVEKDLEHKVCSLSSHGRRKLGLEEQDGEFLKIQVADSGTGIEEKIRKRIFEPFFTTKKKGGGTGLGLASVYGTVLRHHGATEVRSQPGEGAVFTIYLPLSQTR